MTFRHLFALLMFHACSHPQPSIKLEVCHQRHRWDLHQAAVTGERTGGASATEGRGATPVRVGSLEGKRAGWCHVNTTLEGLKIFFLILKYWKGVFNFSSHVRNAN